MAEILFSTVTFGHLYKPAWEASTTVHLVNLPPAALAPQVLALVGVLDSVLVAPLPVQLSAVAWEGSGRWPKSLSPCTHVGELKEAPSSWLQIGSVLAVAANRGVNHQRKTSLSVSLSLSLPLYVALIFK